MTLEEKTANQIVDSYRQARLYEPISPALVLTFFALMVVFFSGLFLGFVFGLFF